MLYESYIHPITILSTLPSAGVGALLALLLSDTELQRHRAHRHHPADRHRQEERDHDDRLRARGRAQRGHESATTRSSRRACCASGRSLMTTMAALLGALPLALGTGTGSELRRPLGIAIVGGLICQPDADALHDAGGLSLSRPAAAGGAGATAAPEAVARGMRRRVMRRSQCCGCLGVALIGASACAVGPNYVRPSGRGACRPPSRRHRRRPEGLEAAHRPMRRHGRLVGDFGDPALNALEARVDVSNQTCAAGRGAVPQARAAVSAARCGAIPDRSPWIRSITRQHASATRSNQVILPSQTATDDIMLPVDFSWEADVWGRVRRNVAAERAGTPRRAPPTSRASGSACRPSSRPTICGPGDRRRGALLEATVDAFQKALELTPTATTAWLRRSRRGTGADAAGDHAGAAHRSRRGARSSSTPSPYSSASRLSSFSIAAVPAARAIRRRFRSPSPSVL